MPRQRRAILVHDYLLVNRGAERVFTVLADMFPGAPVATLLYDADVFGARLAGREVRTSGLQRLHARQGDFKRLLPLMPRAASRLDVSGHDLVVSSSSAFAHGVRPDPGAVHVCYCHTPFRYAWYARDIGVRQAPAPLRPVVGAVLERIRRWDLRAAHDGTHYVANAEVTRQLIADCWGLEAPVVHPPVEVERFAPGPAREDFALVVGELVSHKHVEDAIGAARRAGLPIMVVGDGVDGERLRALHGDHATFLGRVSDTELADLYGRARALLIAAVEEFGITAVEAQAAGCPVVAIDRGGVRETVLPGRTGFLVQSPEEMAEVLASDALDGLDPQAAVANAQRFGVDAFTQQMDAQIRRACGD